MAIIKMQYVKAKELEQKGIVTILPSQLVEVAVDELPKYTPEQVFEFKIGERRKCMQKANFNKQL